MRCLVGKQWGADFTSMKYVFGFDQILNRLWGRSVRISGKVGINCGRYDPGTSTSTVSGGSENLTCLPTPGRDRGKKPLWFRRKQLAPNYCII